MGIEAKYQGTDWVMQGSEDEMLLRMLRCYYGDMIRDEVKP